MSSNACMLTMILHDIKYMSGKNCGLWGWLILRKRCDKITYNGNCGQCLLFTEINLTKETHNFSNFILKRIRKWVIIIGVDEEESGGLN